ncbi:MAG: Ig-like domain-containing protein [Clostridia bacterium]|nr:Ig-like domain-containing protein [Clostridia bacterium]
MPYETHNFLEGQKLTAALLNEMDAQISRNTQAAETYTPQMVDTRIGQLRLDTDGQYIILYYGDQEIAEVAIADVSNIVAAESLTLTSGASLNLLVGDKSQITYTVSPSDANQRTRFLSNALTVATVTSAGLVTALDVGVADVSVMCGQITATVRVTVSRKVSPTWRIGSWMDEGHAAISGNTGLRNQHTGDGRLVCFPTEEEQVLVKQGQTISVQPNATHFIQMFYVVVPGPNTAYEKDYGDHDLITGVTLTELTGQTGSYGTGNGITYAAQQDCYVAFMIGGSGPYTEESAAAFNETNAVTITIFPTVRQA